MQQSLHDGYLVSLDQLRTVNRRRLEKRLGGIEGEVVKKIKAVIKEMLVD